MTFEYQEITMADLGHDLLYDVPTLNLCHPPSSIRKNDTFGTIPVIPNGFRSPPITPAAAMP